MCATCDYIISIREHLVIGITQSKVINNCKAPHTLSKKL